MDAADLRTRQNGAAIRALRRKTGRKVGVLARECGLHPQALVNIENGSRQASIETCELLARALRVDVAAILRDPVDDAA